MQNNVWMNQVSRLKQRKHKYPILVSDTQVLTQILAK